MSLLLYNCSAPNPYAQLHALFDEEWQFRLVEDPLFATSAGYHQYDDRLPQATIADEARRAQFYRELLGKLEKIDRARVSHDDQINYENYIKRLQAFPEYVEQHIDLLKEGLKIGMTMPQVVLQGFDVTMATHVVDDPTQSVF